MSSAKVHGVGMTSLRTRTRMIERLREQGIKDEVVLTAMAAVPRHLFVDEAMAHRAYEDISLPIGFGGQTISQPYIVARMLEVVRGGRELAKVLEIGTGCGYQTAVLAHLALEVFTVERISPLLIKARNQLMKTRSHMKFKATSVKMKHADGTFGLAECAPFDGIVMAAAATRVPQELVEQLTVGGRLVMPVGDKEQQLCLVERLESGSRETILEPVKFVPLRPGVV